MKIDVPTKRDVQRWAREIMFKELQNAVSDVKAVVRSRERCTVKHPAKDDETIDVLCLSVGTMNSLRSLDIETIGQLCKHSQCDLLRHCMNFGQRKLLEVEWQLREVGRRLQKNT